MSALLNLAKEIKCWIIQIVETILHFFGNIAPMLQGLPVFSSGCPDCMLLC